MKLVKRLGNTVTDLPPVSEPESFLVQGYCCASLV